MREGKATAGATKPRGRSKLGLEAWGFAALTCSIVVGLVVWQAARERAALIEREQDDLSRMSQVVASETREMFERIEFYFRTADLWLSRRPNADPRIDPDFAALADRFRYSFDGHLDLRLISAKGELYHLPAAPSDPLPDALERSYFREGPPPGAVGTSIGKPTKSQLTGLWGLPIYYPLSTRNGGIATLAAVIELPDVEATFDAIRPKPSGSVTLIRFDGILLARAPFAAEAIGTMVAGPTLATWQYLLREKPAGIWTLPGSGIDREKRIVAYNYLPRMGLVTSVSARMGDVLEPWMSSIWWRALLAAIMVVAIIMSSSRLVAALGELDAAQGELRENIGRLEKSDATKDKLFSVIAHDLRGPIGGMCNLLETLARDRDRMDEASVDEIVAALRLASWNTYQLLENLLAWSRSQRGDMRFAPERVAILSLAEECEEVYALSAADKGIALRVEGEPGLMAFADPELLKIVLRNLISNAIKFARKGGNVRVSAAPAPGGAKIDVEDDGIGMGAEDLAALFDPGATKSRSGTANERGSGLGLALAKEIVDLHGGSIEVRSEAGSGSGFSVFLPDEPLG